MRNAEGNLKGFSPGGGRDDPGCDEPWLRCPCMEVRNKKLLKNPYANV